ncbi:universal stress protein [Micromonospora sp. NPDC049282]|uniref:universal stress protein n=1 Tax=Micromonospora sp. NPDC049282 TaxID=3364269 RepID=UPI003715096B
MTSNSTGAIVVGVDGSPPSLHAVDWAAREAAARHRPLRIVHAFRWPLTNELMGPPAVGPPDAGLQHAAERMLSAAADRARAAAPTVTVSTDLPAEVPAAALIDASDGADLLVVGHRGLGGFTGLLVGSVGVQTAAHAACPVIVIRASDSDDGHGRTEAGPAAGQVVVGVDNSDVSSPAVDFAFAHAARHGLGVVAVHAYQRAAAGSDAQDEVRARMVTDALAGYRDTYPHVPVREKLIHGRPAAVLAAESAGAALTVVGTRGRGGFTGLLLGSTSQGVLHHASSPVAIVRAHPTRRGGAAGTGARPNAPDTDDVAVAGPPEGTGPTAWPHASPSGSTASRTSGSRSQPG